MSRLKKLSESGQSIWIDYIRRDMFSSGELARLIEKDGVCGLTSNPVIFEKAIAGTEIYAEDLRDFQAKLGNDAALLCEQIVAKDIRMAADFFHETYEKSKGIDGYVSLEVSPHLAKDPAGTVKEAKALWALVDRQNLMIKVPGTKECLPAIEELIAEGINVNVTLLFSMHSYQEVGHAYQRGLQRALHAGRDISRIASVASFFISRIDSLIDKELEEKKSIHLMGKIAIANAKMAYQWYKENLESREWKELAAKGAMPQRLLWASTGTKNPAYSNVLYVESLIGPQTVNTIPPATLDAFRENGSVSATLETGLSDCKGQLEELAGLGISLDNATKQLLKEGIEIFAKAYDNLLGTIKKRLNELG